MISIRKSTFLGFAIYSYVSDEYKLYDFLSKNDLHAYLKFISIVYPATNYNPPSHEKTKDKVEKNDPWISEESHTKAKHKLKEISTLLSNHDAATNVTRNTKGCNFHKQNNEMPFNNFLGGQISQFSLVHESNGCHN